MRPDMGKVLRGFRKSHGRGNVSDPEGYRRRVQRVPFDELPKRESLRRRWASSRSRRYPTTHVSPLRRFLLSNCGRPWSDVFGEICDSIRNGTFDRVLAWGELDRFVTRYEDIVVDDEGVPRLKNHGAFGRWRPVDRRGIRVYTATWVDPRDGVLKQTPDRRKNRYLPDAQYVTTSDSNRVFKKVAGVWYEVELRPVPTRAGTGILDRPLFDGGAAWPHVWDVILKRHVHYYSFNSATWRRMYGGVYYAVAKKQLNGRVIRRLGLNELWRLRQEFAERAAAQAAEKAR